MLIRFVRREGTNDWLGGGMGGRRMMPFDHCVRCTQFTVKTTETSGAEVKLEEKCSRRFVLRSKYLLPVGLVRAMVGARRNKTMVFFCQERIFTVKVHVTVIVKVHVTVIPSP